MADKKLKQEYVMVCPQCKSPDIRQDKSTMQSLGYLPQMYICNRCGHLGYAFPEVEISQLGEFEAEVSASGASDAKKDQTLLVDVSYGKFFVRGVWKISAPILIILGIYAISLSQREFHIWGITSLILGLIVGFFAYRPMPKRAQ